MRSAIKRIAKLPKKAKRGLRYLLILVYIQLAWSLMVTPTLNKAAIAFAGLLLVIYGSRRLIPT